MLPFVIRGLILTKTENDAVKFFTRVLKALDAACAALQALG